MVWGGGKKFASAQELSETEKMVLEFRSSKIVYYQNKEEIPSVDNWNSCLKLARGNWICMVHDDDVLLPGCLKAMYEVVINNANIDFLGCINYDFKSLDELKNITYKYNNKKKIKRVCYEEFMYGMPVPLLGAFFKKSMAIQLGGFDGTSQMGDYVFVAKYAYYFKMFLYKVPLYGYRISMGQDSANNEMNYVRRVADYYLWKSIAQRRKGFFQKLYLKNCQYNLKNRILEYNQNGNYGKNHHIDLKQILKECDIDVEKLHWWEYYLCKGLHVLCMLKQS